MQKGGKKMSFSKKYIEKLIILLEFCTIYGKIYLKVFIKYLLEHKLLEWRGLWDFLIN